MSVRVATVLSVRDWEPALVAHAQETASLKIVLRAFQPRDIERHASDLDVVVAAGDVAWVTPTTIASWRRLGLVVVGVYPADDQPAANLLELGGAVEVVPDSIETEALVQAIRFAAPNDHPGVGSPRGVATAVVGARGAPGASEIACALAHNLSDHSRTLIIDGDLDAPALAIRFGVAPRPDLTDAADTVRSEGVIDGSCVRSVGRFDLIPGSHRVGERPLRAPMLAGVVEAAVSVYEHVVVDVGATDLHDDVLDVIDEIVLVVDASPVGIVRAAQLTNRWFGPTPRVVVNKVTPATRGDTVAAVQRWTGLEPDAVIPLRERVRRNAVAGRLPHRMLCRQLTGEMGR